MTRPESWTEPRSITETRSVNETPPPSTILMPVDGTTPAYGNEVGLPDLPGTRGGSAVTGSGTYIPPPKATTKNKNANHHHHHHHHHKKTHKFRNILRLLRKYENGNKNEKKCKDTRGCEEGGGGVEEMGARGGQRE